MEENKTYNPEFRASKEIPKMKELAIEHLETCRACNQRVASHHMGVGEAFTDVEMKQILDMQASHVVMANEVHEATKTMIEHQNTMFNQLTSLLTEVKQSTQELQDVKRSALPLSLIHI